MIGVDIRLWSHPGIGRYIRELSEAMVRRRGFEHFHFLGYREDLDIFLKRQAGRASFRQVHSKIYSIAEQWEMAVGARGLPVLHVPHFNIPALYPGKLVVTVHDLIYLHDARASRSRLGKPYAEFLFRQIAKKAAAILVVSEYTKNDFLKMFPQVSREKIFVTPEAASPLFQPIEEPGVLEEARGRYGLSKRFVLFVGSLKTHKNIPILMQAVESIRLEERLDVELVLVGRRDPKNRELWEEIQKNRSFVRYLGELPDEDLAALYNLATAFVLPSLREGFGLPVLEAMACGTPVIVSNRASLPEVAAAAGLVFHADRVAELADHLLSVLTDEKLRQRLAMRGLVRAAEFSWNKTADQTLAVYDRVAGGRRR